MPLDGGVARQLSFERSGVRLHGWTPDGDVLFSTLGLVGPNWSWTLRRVNPDSLVTQTIPLADAVEGVIDSAGKYVYFVQFGLQVSQDNTRVYRGGAQGQLWRYRLGSDREAEPLTTDHAGSVRQPMLNGDRLYFVSDASGRDNIWSMRLDGSDLRQVTQHSDWSVRGASLHNGKIVYQLGADLQLLTLDDGEIRTLGLQLSSDFQPASALGEQTTEVHHVYPPCRRCG